MQRKRRESGKAIFATGEREEEVIAVDASVAACAVVAMTSVTRLCIMSHHVRRRRDRKSDRIISTNVHYIYLGGDNNHL